MIVDYLSMLFAMVIVLRFEVFLVCSFLVSEVLSDEHHCILDRVQNFCSFESYDFCQSIPNILLSFGFCAMRLGIAEFQAVL